MEAKRRNRFLSLCLILFLGLPLLTGCSRQAKHDVLSFFFTGVPPLEKGNKVQGKGVKGSDKIGESAKKRKRPGPQFFLHGPNASNRCFLCHATSASISFRKTGEEKKFGTGGKPSVSASGRLILPLNRLCFQCHVDKSVEKAQKRGLWVHGPAASGKCIICHDPHKSKNRYMLKKKGRDLCLQCHGRGNIVTVKNHKGKEECLSCHNAHMGKNRMMLTKDYREIF